MDRANFFQRWSELHGNAKVEGIVRGWLTLSYVIIKPLTLLRVSPNLVTIGGLVFSIVLWRNNSSWWGVLFLTLSLLCDGIDGSLAIIRHKESLRGSTLDAIIDRLAEVFWALTFYAIGGHFEIIFLAWLFAFTQEYARARMGSLGIHEIGVLSIAERPVRASLLGIALIANLMFLNFVEPIALIWLGMQAYSLVAVMRFGYLRLKKA